MVELFGGNIMAMLSIRLIIASLPYLLFAKRIQFIKFAKSTLALCLVQPGINLITQTYAARISDVSLIAYVTALGPIITHIIARIMIKEKASKKFLAFLALSIAGSIVAVYNGESSGKASFAAVCLTLASLVCRGIYSSLAREEAKRAKPYEVAAFQCFFGAVAYSCAALFTGQFRALPEIAASLGLKGILWLLYLSLISISSSYILNNILLNQVSASMGGVMANATFLFTLAVAVFVRGERVGWHTYVGSIALIIGIFGASLSKEGSSA
ncbi:MAG: DMT family transporter [Eubacteriaceae bacterium]|nr:DMT family transporter [Eubacteriaceae bacterium]